jgi:FtsP/CotA-like multicopper oxidase with cupredoxin domain
MYSDDFQDASLTNPCPVDPMRRALLLASSTVPFGLVRPVLANEGDWLELQAGATNKRLVPGSIEPTPMWLYNGSHPGPVIRVRQGGEVKVRLHNQLPQPTTVHWHGLRVPNALDGVPGFTQPPIASGETFTYRFVAQDAGTFWYHPHFNTIEQIGRGLSGAVVVAEADPVEVDEDWLWVLSDFRLDRKGQIDAQFKNLHDAAHAGRVGNVVLINGSLEQDFSARPYARIRLRLVAATSARIFGLTFKGCRAWLMALDGHPVAIEPLNEPLVLAPGQRADVLWEAPAANQTSQVIDAFYSRQSYELAALRPRGAPVRPTKAEPRPLPPNRLPSARPLNQPPLSMVLQGGAMSREATREAVWLINGKAMTGEGMDAGAMAAPLFVAKANTAFDVVLDNQTRWLHPLHFHGAWLRQGQGEGWGPIRDTLLLQPNQKILVRVQVGEPGQWMVHCHVIGHQATGMMGYFLVT